MGAFEPAVVSLSDVGEYVAVFEVQDWEGHLRWR